MLLGVGCCAKLAPTGAAGQVETGGRKQSCFAAAMFRPIRRVEAKLEWTKPITTHSSIDVGVECEAASRSAADSAANSSPHVVWNPERKHRGAKPCTYPRTVIIHQAPQTAAPA